MTLTYRRVTTHADYHAMEELQEQVWGGGERDIVPLHVLVTANKHGGLALGAFDTALAPPGDMVGFVFGFVGLTSAGQVKHCSHMLAVLPAYRDRGVGEELKQRQRDYVLAQGITLMTWTYDPLQSRNAWLNIRKLGATCRTYIRNLYGAMADGLNAGLPSDRFEVEWHLASRHTAERLGRVVAAPVLAALAAEGVIVLNESPEPGNDAPATACRAPTGERVLIRFPADINAIKIARPTEALAWRMQLRELCEAAFTAGYAVVDVLADGACSYYLLQQNGSPE
ncbi:MAG: hypothetical protein HXY39_16700 [Chloroflexi bacterium]|nr:hypothetical protein [Chloroflexota bacterium]